MAADKHIARAGQELNAVKDMGHGDRHDADPGRACADGDFQSHARNHRGGARWEVDIDKRARSEGSVGRRRARKENVLLTLVQYDLRTVGVIGVIHLRVG